MSCVICIDGGHNLHVFYVHEENCMITVIPPVDMSGSSGSGIPRARSFRTLRHEFELQDACDFIKCGAEVRGRDGGRERGGRE